LFSILVVINHHCEINIASEPNLGSNRHGKTSHQRVLTPKVSQRIRNVDQSIVGAASHFHLCANG